MRALVGFTRRVTVGVLALMLTNAAFATKGPPPIRFDLDASDAVTALNEFSVQADMQVLFVFEAVKDIRLPALHADLDARSALTRMLQGTGLRFTFVNDRTIAIDRAKAVTVPATRAAPAPLHPPADARR
ncbi:MAG: STN domain-containing protein [Gammaproteobacteria bacterium]